MIFNPQADFSVPSSKKLLFYPVSGVDVEVTWHKHMYLLVQIAEEHLQVKNEIILSLLSLSRE